MPEFVGDIEDVIMQAWPSFKLNSIARIRNRNTTLAVIALLGLMPC